MPSVSAGRIRCSSPPRPQTGSQPRYTEKIRIKRGPSQKAGTAVPKDETMSKDLSSHEPLRAADSTPRGREIRMEKARLAEASSSVAMSLMRTSGRTGRP